jgi:Ca2+-binding EF-hand superfamily protein
MINKLLERITLTKEDIAGMINDAVKKQKPAFSENTATVNNNDATTPEISKNDIEKLRKQLESIKEKYSKYLSIFYYFDPNSLGTISEVLLAKLLNSSSSDIKAVHTGASGGLTDLIVDGIPISLKTTASGKAIGLGSDEVLVGKGDVGNISKELRTLGATDGETISSLMKSADPKRKSVAMSLQKRISAIATKISGKDNKEVLVWAEKIYSKSGILIGIKIHIRDYIKNDVETLLMNSPVYLTEKAWGIKDSNGTILVQADNSGKALNIMPAFIYQTSIDNPIDIQLPVPNLSGEFAAKVKQEIPDRLFNALDNIHQELFGVS